MEPTKEEEVPKTTTWHLSVAVDLALEYLRKGKNLFEPASSNEVLKELTRRENKGIECICGCSNETPNGKCGGHYKKSIRKNAKLYPLPVIA